MWTCACVYKIGVHSVDIFAYTVMKINMYIVIVLYCVNVHYKMLSYVCWDPDLFSVISATFYYHYIVEL